MRNHEPLVFVTVCVLAASVAAPVLQKMLGRPGFLWFLVSFPACAVMTGLCLMARVAITDWLHHRAREHRDEHRREI
jgi:hypothetical protein